jgi:hypothetical protein
MAKNNRKIIISCAITGSVHTPTMSEYLPITPSQIVDRTWIHLGRVFLATLKACELFTLRTLSRPFRRLGQCENAPSLCLFGTQHEVAPLTNILGRVCFAPPELELFEAASSSGDQGPESWST